ncbi:putative SOS response-associated peptidase YedK [Scopulibacillus darangshiensis]|uniref:Abasic site processing protein n=1 Tax=Scopulibacillus darangshiensis TaxID=442528 RepID=A0A4V6NQN5_9BACL|nr:SOS response-associated peptidase [Scopulibacillus darangshiensis]TCP29066.1 putative SOS response-associated peptidase YedK [Scopulibacillus darangshiensis]
MCGRFTLFTDLDVLIDQFNLFNSGEIQYQPRYNIAPSQPILSVINDGKNNRAGFLRWGLVPSFAKDKSIGYKMINARAETIDEKPTFKRLLARRRCLIIADSFYEWRRDEGKKTPMRIHMLNNDPFALAGLWDRWESPDGEEITSCTIITTKPNDLMKDIHDRMPVILSKEDEGMWLDRSVNDKQVLKQLLVPYDAEKMEAYEVSNVVNSPRNEMKECIREV